MYIPGEYYELYDVDSDKGLATFLGCYVGEDLEEGWHVFSILYNQDGAEADHMYDGYKLGCEAIGEASDGLIRAYQEHLDRWQR